MTLQTTANPATKFRGSSKQPAVSGASHRVEARLELWCAQRDPLHSRQAAETQPSRRFVLAPYIRVREPGDLYFQSNSTFVWGDALSKEQCGGIERDLFKAHQPKSLCAA
jgi:hypothetical protein